MSAEQQLVHRKIKLENEEDEILHLNLQKNTMPTFNLSLLQPPSKLLVLSLQGIDDADFMPLLCEGIRNNKTITSLTLSWYYEIPGFQYLAKVILHNTTLTHLHFWEFQYTAAFSPEVSVEEKKITLLANALKLNTTLTSLSLVSNDATCRRMSTDNIKHLLIALNENRSLFEIHFMQFPYHLNLPKTIQIMQDYLSTQRMLQYHERMKRRKLWGLISVVCIFYRTHVNSSYKHAILDLLPGMSKLAENTATGLFTVEEQAKQQAEKLENERRTLNQFMKKKIFHMLSSPEKLDGAACSNTKLRTKP